MADIKHSGVKGMHWGVRKQAKADKKWAKKINKTSGGSEAIKIWNSASKAMNSGIQAKINAKYPGDLTKDPKRHKKYLEESAKALEHELNKTLESRIGSVNPSGTYKASIHVDKTTLAPYVKVDKIQVKHAVDSTSSIIIDLALDKTGHIVEFMPPKDVLMQSGMDFLEHYGVKGMHWGVRRNAPKKEIKIANKRQKMSDNRRLLDAKDLDAMVARLEKEKKLKDLVEQDLTPGKKAAKAVMSDVGQKVARTVIAGAAIYGVKAALEKKFSASEAAKYITPKPKK